MQSKPTIIIVDNGDDDHEPVSLYLACQGYPVMVAQSRDDALEIMTECLPDTILLDYRANGTPDGFITFARTINPYMPFVLMNGIDDIDLKAHTHECRFFVKKLVNAA